MTAETGRTQDQDRKHARKGRPSPETAALLDAYQEAMRTELRDLLASLAPVPQDQGLGMVDVPPKRPPLSERSKIWDLAIKLGRELGQAIDPMPAPGPAVAGKAGGGPRIGKVDMG